MEEDDGSGYVTTDLGMELDAITDSRVHDMVEGHENTLDEVAVKKEDAHNDPSESGRGKAHICRGESMESAVGGIANTWEAGPLATGGEVQATCGLG
jgi:hypothetical protein